MATEYVTLSVDIHFEPGHVACQYCPLMTTYSRNQCMRTGELLLDPKVTVGRWCPLYEKEERHEEMSEV
jgi:hypothetical protein